MLGGGGEAPPVPAQDEAEKVFILVLELTNPDQVRSPGCHDLGLSHYSTPHTPCSAAHSHPAPTRSRSSPQRESALLELSKRRETFADLAPILWHSFGTVSALLQEIVAIYPLLSPPSLTAQASNRVCNALALLQCVASHPETRTLFLNGAPTPSACYCCVRAHPTASALHAPPLAH